MSLFLAASSGKSVTAATMRKALAQSGNLDDSLFGDIHEAISDKAPPSQLLQFLIIVQRTCIKRFREFYPTIVIDICLLLATACVVGAIHGTEWKLQDVPGNAVMAQTAVATLTGVTFLRTFTKVCVPSVWILVRCAWGTGTSGWVHVGYRIKQFTGENLRMVLQHSHTSWDPPLWTCHTSS